MLRTRYLRRDILVEPLVNRWTASVHLVSPMTAPLVIANAHVPLMTSFAAMPALHVNALKNPEMLGGPYIHLAAEHADAVRRLLDATLRDQAPMIAFADAVRALEALVAREAGGFAMDALYARVPPPLKGYVELVYDLGQRPGVRYLEGLLYHSRYANLGAQSVSLSPYPGDDRPFVLNTPRLPSPGALTLPLPFRDPRLDALFRAQTEPADVDALAAGLEVPPEARALFDTYFHDDPPPPPPTFLGPGVRIRYFGHACLLIESRDVSLLVDPQVSYPTHHGPARFDRGDLPEVIDYVVISHGHQDHVILEALLPLRHKVRNVLVPKNGGGDRVDPSLKLFFQHLGFGGVYEIEEGERVPLPGGAVTGLPFPGEHGDLNIRSKSAYHVALEGASLFLGVDSNNLEPLLYHHIHDLCGDVDALFMGLECEGAPQSWAYGPLAVKKLSRQMDASRRLSSSDAAKCVAMVEALRPRAVFTYAMGREPWLTYLTSLVYADDARPLVEARRLVQHCRDKGLLAAELYCKNVIEIGADGDVAASPRRIAWK